MRKLFDLNEEQEVRVEALHQSTVVINTYGGPYTGVHVLEKCCIVGGETLWHAS